jgi:hypothetical protein
MIEGGMIDWLKRKDGSWKFDYNIFEQYVQLAMSAGIDKAITIYTPVPWDLDSGIWMRQPACINMNHGPGFKGI